MIRRLPIALCALLTASPAFASVSLTGAGKAGSAVAGYTGPGDIVGSAKGWWGLRAYTAAIAAGGTTAAIKIVRASDGQTCDILLNSAGGLGNTASCSGAGNGTAVATFCNATTCTINLWYDQTGNGNTMTQGTVGSQATLTFSCLGSLPCATFTGSQVYTSSLTSTSQPFTFSAVAIRTSTTTQNDLLGNAEGFFFNNTANQVGEWFGNVTYAAAATDAAWHALQMTVDNPSSASVIAVDATQNSSGNPGGIAFAASPSLGGHSGTPTLNGKLTEAGLWTVAFNSGQMTSMCHQQFTYWGTSVSC